MAAILLVDDEESVLKSLGTLFETEGHSVARVPDGEEAIRRLDARQYDVMVTDLRMAPMDGMALIRQVKEKRPAMPIVVISAYTSDATVQQSLESGCAAYIKKPFKIGELLNAINKAVGKSQ